MSILTSPRRPELPESEWDSVLRGRALDLHKIFASLYAVGNTQDRFEKFGGLEIRVPSTTAGKKIITQSDWATAWQAASTAILFVFPHRGSELATYQTHVNKQFRAIGPRRHDRVITYDQAVRTRVGQRNDLQLSDVIEFTDLLTEHVLLFGNDQATGRSSEKRAANKIDEVCKRYNVGTCTLATDSCRYKHACASCGGAGHRSKDCGKKKL
jgi:hypothetical protein